MIKYKVYKSAFSFNFHILFSFFLIAFLILNSKIVLSQTTDPQLTSKLRDLYEDYLSKLSLKNINISIDIRSLENNGIIFQKNHEDFIPIASVQKILLSYAVLKKLGPDYKFPTEFYVDFQTKDLDPRIDAAGGMERKVSNLNINSQGNLYVRGYGDPTLQHSDLYEIVHQLKARGVSEIEDLILDTSLFLEERPPTGIESYKAANTALPIEFNSYRLIINPAISGQRAKVTVSPGLSGAEILNRITSFSSGDQAIEISQSPDSKDLWRERPSNIKTNQFLLPEIKFKILLDGRIGKAEEAFEKYLSHPSPTQYFGSSLKKVILDQGIKFNGNIKLGIAPKNSKIVYTRESKSLGEILYSINKYSSNFTAGQLVFAMGQNEEGIFDYNLGLNEFNKIINQIDKFPTGGILLDGSGLSSENRVSLSQILSVLKEVYNEPVIGPVFISSLSRIGASGTLKNRNLLSSRAAVYTTVYKEEKKRSSFIWAKTGTIDNVSGISGYAQSKLGEKLVFAIIISGQESKEDSVKIENKFLETIIGVSE